MAVGPATQLAMQLYLGAILGKIRVCGPGLRFAISLTFRLRSAYVLPTFQGLKTRNRKVTRYKVGETKVEVSLL